MNERISQILADVLQWLDFRLVTGGGYNLSKHCRASSRIQGVS